jgi:hypothetical protein
MKKNCASGWLFTKIIPRCKVNRILKKTPNNCEKRIKIYIHAKALHNMAPLVKAGKATGQYFLGVLLRR